MGDQPGAEGQELTATQYVILAENQRKKKALAETKTQFARVADENAALLKQLTDTHRENYDVTEHMRRELLAKTEKITELEGDLIQVANDHDEEFAKEKALAKEREVRQAVEAKARQAALQLQVDGLTAELASVHEFKLRQAEVEDDVLKLKEENQELREKLEQQKTDLERYYLELNTKMRKEYEQRLEELKKSAEEEIDERLDSSVKRILQQNRRMAEELRIHVQETDVLQKEVRILEEERGRLTREVGLKTEMEGGFAKRGARQAMAIKESQAKIAQLEHSLQQVLGDFEREKGSILRVSQQQVADARAEGEALRRMVKLKTRELKNVRRLAQEVLLQRSDVETFLLSSLHQVRRELERSAFESRSAAGPGSSVLPPLGSIAGQLDMKDLAWEDRERVLRLLFAKINNQSQHTQFSKLPAHPLEPGLQGTYNEGGPAGLV